MALALYAPGLGYYANAQPQVRPDAASGSDFVTAPELSPLFGRALARQVAQALEASGTDEVWEFGAGSGALARSCSRRSATAVARYTHRRSVGHACASASSERLARIAGTCRVARRAADSDARRGGRQRGARRDAGPAAGARRRGVARARRRRCDGERTGLAWRDRPTDAAAAGGRSPARRARLPHRDPCAGRGLRRDPRRAPERGRRLLHRLRLSRSRVLPPAAQRRHADVPPRRTAPTPTRWPTSARKDITAHVDFTGIALAAQDAGLDVLGYTSQARFLINCGLLDLLARRRRCASARRRRSCSPSTRWASCSR